jgi:hypothetical protein
MSIQASAVTVGTAAVLIISGEDYAAGSKDGRVTYEILNNGTATLYIGGTNSVTTANGSPLPAGGARTLDLRLGSVVYAIAGAAGQDVRILKVG